jgi:hypothetical protein
VNLPVNVRVESGVLVDVPLTVPVESGVPVNALVTMPVESGVLVVVPVAMPGLRRMTHSDRSAVVIGHASAVR